jgi:chromosome segregation ATPase
VTQIPEDLKFTETAFGLYGREQAESIARAREEARRVLEEAEQAGEPDVGLAQRVQEILEHVRVVGRVVDNALRWRVDEAQRLAAEGPASRLQAEEMNREIEPWFDLAGELSDLRRRLTVARASAQAHLARVRLEDLEPRIAALEPQVEQARKDLEESPQARYDRLSTELSTCRLEARSARRTLEESTQIVADGGDLENNMFRPMVRRYE